MLRSDLVPLQPQSKHWYTSVNVTFGQTERISGVGFKHNRSLASKYSLVWVLPFPFFHHISERLQLKRPEGRQK
jgi:hypothetical protein